MTPKFCKSMMHIGSCDKGENCDPKRHHNKTKEQHNAQPERWNKTLTALREELKTAKCADVSDSDRACVEIVA